LEEKVKLYDLIGTPPPILRIMGENHLEKPFNRILKWCSDVNAEHKLGREFLRQLSSRVGFSQLMDDLTNAEIEPSVYGEEAVDLSGNEPDLIVLTPNAALLLENKVGSPESGDQYKPYREWFPSFAKKRKIQLVLSARDERPVPDGWDCAIRHEDIAEIFRSLSLLDGVPLWSRILAVQCAVSFSNTLPDDRIASARKLLAETGTGRIKPDRLRKFRGLTSIPLPSTPWSPT
jgi:hypothetical protein